MKTHVKGMVSDTLFMACRHSRVETAFYLECLIVRTWHCIALMRGVVLVGVYPTRHCSPCRGNPFQVQGVCRWTTLTRGRCYEESRVVAFN